MISCHLYWLCSIKWEIHGRKFSE